MITNPHIGHQLFIYSIIQVVTDLIYVACYFCNWNVFLTTVIMICRLSFGFLPTFCVALYGFFWQCSLVILVGILNCLSLIHLSIAHGWAWVHDWLARSIHLLCSTVILAQFAAVMGTDIYRVIFFSYQYWIFVLIINHVNMGDFGYLF